MWQDQEPDVCSIGAPNHKGVIGWAPLGGSQKVVYLFLSAIQVDITCNKKVHYISQYHALGNLSHYQKPEAIVKDLLYLVHCFSQIKCRCYLNK